LSLIFVSVDSVMHCQSAAVRLRLQSWLMPHPTISEMTYNVSSETLNLVQSNPMLQSLVWPGSRTVHCDVL